MIPRRSRSRLHLTAAAVVVVVTSAVVAQTAAGADTSTSTSTTSTTSTTTTSPGTSSSTTTTTSSGSTGTSSTTTTSSSTPPTTSGTPGTAAPSTAALGQVPAITGVPSAVPLFIVAGTTSTAPPGTAIPFTSMNEVAAYVELPNPELTDALQTFFDQGGTDAYLWLTVDEQPATLLAAITQIAQTAQTDTPATMFVIPAMATLDGQDYLDVASSLAALAEGTLGLALLDAPATVIATVRAAWPDVSALADLTGQLQTAVAAKSRSALRSAAFYPTPLVDSSSGATVSAAVVMAGIITRQDEMAGLWTAPAGTSVPAFGLDVLLPIDNVQQTTLGLAANPFRSFPNYGTVMWGARTLDVNSLDHRYIQTDRTLDWIQHSLSVGLDWTVFEPNDQATQELVEQSVSSFLTTQWKVGALVGDRADEAFQISVDDTGPSTGSPSAGQGLVLRVDLVLVHPVESESIELPLATATG